VYMELFGSRAAGISGSNDAVLCRRRRRRCYPELRGLRWQWLALGVHPATIIDRSSSLTNGIGEGPRRVLHQQHIACSRIRDI
jgi:hypothetical protein